MEIAENINVSVVEPSYLKKATRQESTHTSNRSKMMGETTPSKINPEMDGHYGNSKKSYVDHSWARRP